MDEFKTEKASFSAEDFQMWDTNGVLLLTPKFQRRPVWKLGAKSFLIDTILRGMTIPPIYLRHAQNAEKTKTIREVVDGQQRIRSVLDFISPDGFRLSRALGGPWAGKRFADLSADEQRKILSFGFSCESFKGISDRQVLEVFCRLNMNGVPLNRQELRNGKFFGPFKQACYALAFVNLEFWRKQKIFTEMSIARMLEVELVSELLIAINAGMQDKKNTIDDFYEKWDESYPSQNPDALKFTETMSTISETFGVSDLAETEFRRPPMFFTLFCVTYHHLYGLPEIVRQSPRRKLNADQRESLKDAVAKLSEVLEQSKDPARMQGIPTKYAAFVLASSRQSDNVKPRRERFNTLYETAFLG